MIIDYGLGNLLSVARGFEKLGISAKISSNPIEILAGSHVVLPGVGAFPKGMEKLNSNGLDLVVKNVAAKGTPLLGICLGMQLLLDDSQEFGLTKGLGLVSGHVKAIPQQTSIGDKLTIPHVGWNKLEFYGSRKRQRDSILDGIKDGEFVYFVHSYMALLESNHDIEAVVKYGGHEIASVISKNSVFGCQFHPEKSGEVGLKILKNFLQAR